MKPFLGIDLTNNRKNEEINGTEFLVARPSAAMTQSLEKSAEKAEETVERAKAPLPLRIAQWVCGAVGAVFALGIIKGLAGNDSVSIPQAYENAPWLFWTCGGCLLIWGILKLASKKKEKTVLETEESVQTLGNLEGVCNAVFAELAVPSQAKEVDVLSFYYKVKGDDVKVCEKAMQLWNYFNPVFRVFADGENLYLANLEGKYAFPKSQIKGIRPVEKKVRMMGWNKEAGYDEGIYKQYKLARDNYGCIHCKRHHIVEIQRDGETWGIYIPDYELPVFEELIK